MTVLTCEHTMCDNEDCFYAHSPEKPKNPLKELSDEQLVEKAIDESVEVARYNRAEHERTSHPDYDPYNDPDGPSEDMLVSECNDRLQLRDMMVSALTAKGYPVLLANTSSSKARVNFPDGTAHRVTGVALNIRKRTPDGTCAGGDRPGHGHRGVRHETR